MSEDNGKGAKRRKITPRREHLQMYQGSDPHQESGTTSNISRDSSGETSQIQIAGPSGFPNISYPREEPEIQYLGVWKKDKNIKINNPSSWCYNNNPIRNPGPYPINAPVLIRNPGPYPINAPVLMSHLMERRERPPFPKKSTETPHAPPPTKSPFFNFKITGRLPAKAPPLPALSNTADSNTISRNVLTEVKEKDIPCVYVDIKPSDDFLILTEITRRFPDTEQWHSRKYIVLEAPSFYERNVLIDWLEWKRISYSLYEPPAEGCIRAVIKGIPLDHHVSPDDLKDDLIKKGFRILNIFQVREAKTRVLLPVYFVDLKKAADSTQIFNLKECFNLPIVVKRYKQLKKFRKR